jgi:hypothetical protein
MFYVLNAIAMLMNHKFGEALMIVMTMGDRFVALIKLAFPALVDNSACRRKRLLISGSKSLDLS